MVGRLRGCIRGAGMIHLTHETVIQLALQPLDFRKGMDGVAAVCREQLQQDPRSGQLFVFFNRSRTMIRVLVYEGKGFWLMSKRLSRGRFPRISSTQSPLSRIASRDLRQLLSGHLPMTLQAPRNGLND